MNSARPDLGSDFAGCDLDGAAQNVTREGDAGCKRCIYEIRNQKPQGILVHDTKYHNRSY